MKITSRQYAQALYDLTKDKQLAEIKQITKKFVELLINNRDLSKAKEISNHFQKIWLREENIVEANIVSARKLDKDVIKSVSDYIKKTTKAKELIIKEDIDKNILGGVIIKYQDKIMDGSIKTKLIELKKEIIK